jgi:hypothetical protein
METIHAKYDGNALAVFDNSSGLPTPPEHSGLIDYLSSLSLTGWEVVEASFTKEELTLQIHRTDQIPYPIPVYLIQTLNQTPNRRGNLDLTWNELNGLVSSLQETAIRLGWQVLATSKPMLRKGRLLVSISLWVKENPPGNNPPTSRF